MSWWKLTRDTIETIVIALLLALLIRGLFLESFVVQYNSMEPTLHDGQRLLVNKFVYRVRPPRRGDIIVFQYPRDPERDFIKRVAAVGGDTVEIAEGRVFVNGRRLEEPYVEFVDTGSHALTKVPPGMLFVLGDNRANSEDSRSFGFVPRDNVKGRAFLVFWPLSDLTLLGGA